MNTSSITIFWDVTSCFLADYEISDERTRSCAWELPGLLFDPEDRGSTEVSLNFCLPITSHRKVTRFDFCKFKKETVHFTGKLK
jgi:hypothetical protein